MSIKLVFPQNHYQLTTVGSGQRLDQKKLDQAQASLYRTFKSQYPPTERFVGEQIWQNAKWRAKSVCSLIERDPDTKLCDWPNKSVIICYSMINDGLVSRI